MCGFTGSFCGRRPLGTDAVRRADLDALRHRGPDSDGWYEDAHGTLGFRRLAIIDVDGGDQPLFDTPKDTVLTLNGEIYNHRELRRSLRGTHQFRTRSDAEVLVHRYAEQGLEGLTEGVNGMFAFALYDVRRRRVVLGRDRAGQKPLYWSFDDGVLRWASELKALLGTERPSVSEQAVNDYLRFGYVPSPLTMFEGVYKLPAGCLLICGRDGAPQVQRYWQLDYAEGADRPLQPGEDAAWQDRLHEALSAAVARRLESEVRLGFLLSGGVDSASVFAVGARAKTDAGVQAFTIGFPGDEVDETVAAAELANKWGAEHLVRNVREDESLDLGRVLFLTEEPLSTDALLPTARVFEQVSEAGFTTVLTGEGSDEIMAGYSKFAAACSWVTDSPGWPTQGSPLDRYLAHEEFAFPAATDRDRLLGTPVDDSRFDALEQEAEHLDPLGQMLHFEARLRLPDRINPRLDRLSMAWSIEARAPFMDYELQELCAAMPHRLRRGPKVDKYMLRESMRPLLTDAVLDAPKAPFRAPARWFVTPEHLEAELSEESVEAAGLVQHEAVRALVNGEAADPHRRQEELYSLYVLHAWHRSFVREPPASVGAAIGIA